MWIGDSHLFTIEMDKKSSDSKLNSLVKEVGIATSESNWLVLSDVHYTSFEGNPNKPKFAFYGLFMDFDSGASCHLSFDRSLL